MMTFGEKVKTLRKENGLSQTKLADQVHVSFRTIRNWETAGKLPKSRQTYLDLAETFGCDVSYLMDDKEDFILKAKEKYSSRGAAQARELANRVSGLFAGGQVLDDALDDIMKIMMDSFWKAKELNRKKYTPKKYRHAEIA